MVSRLGVYIIYVARRDTPIYIYRSRDEHLNERLRFTNLDSPMESESETNVAK